jgi:two-component system response regulator
VIQTEPKIILLVEDNPDDELLTLRALKQGRIKNQVVVKRDGAEAVDYLFNEKGESKLLASEIPQLILLDLKLPKIDGLEVLTRIRKAPNFARIPVVILTSSREEADVVRGYDLGANSYICKPVDVDQFSKAVQELELYWLVLNETPARTSVANR